ncbi:Hypothetical protein ORPV_1060 [Orpheovirus IHUMI-LCC2]|uniref:Uncharacterized protein n=1 Tax=Orpheovirus IHUMI-LCC2 TaxID=2023057 RepID=A0A2I2L602_9VIRU|nr:Hypothetical protein ORPV_1060 [Orpheovirus IHUMI-LCC2]SNW62964.1 Hypothetical protein ORPV_1060 [Orpheovirus IHUMI-LCC2]
MEKAILIISTFININKIPEYRVKLIYGNLTGYNDIPSIHELINSFDLTQTDMQAIPKYKISFITIPITDISPNISDPQSIQIGTYNGRFLVYKIGNLEILSQSTRDIGTDLIPDYIQLSNLEDYKEEIHEEEDTEENADPSLWYSSLTNIYEYKDDTPGLSNLKYHNYEGFIAVGGVHTIVRTYFNTFIEPPLYLIPPQQQPYINGAYNPRGDLFLRTNKDDDDNFSVNHYIFAGQDDEDGNPDYVKLVQTITDNESFIDLLNQYYSDKYIGTYLPPEVPEEVGEAANNICSISRAYII